MVVDEHVFLGYIRIYIWGDQLKHVCTEGFYSQKDVQNFAERVGR